MHFKRILLTVAVVLTGCRTRLLDSVDAFAPPIPVDAAPLSDLAKPVDAANDLASRDGTSVLCGSRVCDHATELCVLLNRGDCAGWICAPLPPQCAENRGCDCLGASFCPSLAQVGETLKCLPPQGAAEIVCISNIQCV